MFYFARRSLATHVEVLKAELSQGIVQSLLDVLGAVLVVPQLGGDEEVLALEAGDLSEGLLHAIGDLLLVLIDLGEIEVLVAGLEGLVDAGGDLTGGGLPCLRRWLASIETFRGHWVAYSVAQSRDLVSRGQGSSLAEGHFCGILAWLILQGMRGIKKELSCERSAKSGVEGADQPLWLRPWGLVGRAQHLFPPLLAASFPRAHQ